MPFNTSFFATIPTPELAGAFGVDSQIAAAVQAQSEQTTLPPIVLKLTANPPTPAATNIFSGFNTQVLAEAFGIDTDLSLELQEKSNARGNLVTVLTGLG